MSRGWVLATVLCAFVVASPAAAGAFYGLRIDRSHLRFYDWETHQRSGSIARLLVVEAPATATDAADSDVVGYEFEADCAAASARVVRVEYYSLPPDDPFREIPSSHTPWIAAEPGSLEEEALHAACAATPPTESSLGEGLLLDLVSNYRAHVSDGSIK